jgi:HD-GYP domain-containing protein (c-di-GMP phosphodiesterase class II)
VSPELFEAIQDKKMAPAQKSRAVYHHSREMMDRLLEVPTAENLQAGKEAIRSVSDLVLSDNDTATAMLRITAHDFYTYTHSVNVGLTSLMLAKAMFGNSDGHDMHELAAGFFLHDLGKVKVDPAIINKPARLTETEMRRMRIHPYQGYKILKEAQVMSEECRIVVMEHHELFDGNGYPKRIGGDQIHLYGRICCIADVFDALTAERSYKQAMTPFDALSLMRDKMPYHFDKELFAQFVTLFKA